MRWASSRNSGRDGTAGEVVITILDRLRHLAKWEWVKLTEPCNAVLSVYEARCALAEIEGLTAERDALKAALEEAVDWLKDTTTEGTRVRLNRWRAALAKERGAVQPPASPKSFPGKACDDVKACPHVCLDYAEGRRCSHCGRFERVRAPDQTTEVPK